MERDEKALAVQLEKEHEAREEAKKNAEKVNLVKEPKVEEKKYDENPEPIKKSRDVDKYIETSQGYELADGVESSSGDDLGGQTGTSTLEKPETTVDEPTSAENFSFEHDEDSAAMNFGESLSSRQEYEESWEQFINGA